MLIQKYVPLVLLPGLALSFQHFQHPNYHLINDDRCGLQSPRQRIINGRQASLGEFPWMVYVETRKLYFNGSIGYMGCGGSILNRKYILSASHCIVDREAARTESIFIVGEYDKRRDPDCVNYVCAPNVVVYEPEQVINHPKYFAVQAGFDITLIRVRGVINFNEFVAPICLEHGPLLRNNYVGESAIVAGWGAYVFADFYRKHYITADVLQTLTVPIMDDRSCKDVMLKLASYYREYHVIESLVCAGGVVERFVYKGDSGGPLMVVKQIDPFNVPRFYQIGLVSLGPDANESPLFRSPIVYTRLRYYLKWILDSMRP